VGGASVRLWDARTGVLLRRLPGRQGVWSPDARHVATALEGTVTVRDTQTGEPLKAMHDDHGVWSMRWSPAGPELAVGSAGDAAVRIWDTRDGTLRQVLRPGPDEIGQMALPYISWSPDGSRLAVWTGSYVGCWDTATGVRVSRHQFGAPVAQVEWAPHRHQLLVRTDQHTRIWDLDPDRVALTLRTPSGNDDDARWSPGGDLIATLNNLGYLRIWDAGDGGCRLSVRVKPDLLVSECCWSPDGTRVATPHWDGTIAVWSVHDTIDRLVRRAHDVLPRRLTAAERAEYQLD
ncbi:MAG: WD40 repeat domain-containing protein, partial [Actinoplanes sp.]